MLMGKHGLKGNMWRQVVPLWGFILTMLALGSILYIFLERSKTGPVIVNESGIETPYGKAGYADVRRVYVHREIGRSMIDPGVGRDTVSWLIIEERNGKKHHLSEEQYDLPGIMKSLGGFLEENRKMGNKKGG